MSHFDQVSSALGRALKIAATALGSEPAANAAPDAEANHTSGGRLEDCRREVELLTSQLAAVRDESAGLAAKVSDLIDRFEELSWKVNRWNPAVIERAEMRGDLDRRLAKLAERVGDLAETTHTVNERTTQASSTVLQVLALLQDQTALQRRLERIEEALAIRPD